MKNIIKKLSLLLFLCLSIETYSQTVCWAECFRTYSTCENSAWNSFYNSIADINQAFLNSGQYDTYNNDSDFFLYGALVTQEEDVVWSKIEQCIWQLNSCVIGCEH